MSMYDDTVDVTPEGVSEGAALSGMFGESAPVETERGIETITEEIIFYKNVGGQAVIEIGRRLTEAKAQLKHGEWLPWLREKVEFSETSAQNFMRIAREYGNTHLVGDLGASKALVLLALPASERENFASEKHLVNGEEKSVSEMSKRELEEAIRQRKLAELKAAETARELDRQKEATAEAEAAAEKAQEAAEAARAEVENAKSISLAAQERTAELERELKALREKPVDVAVQTVDASAEQIAAAVKEAEKAAKAKRDAAVAKKAEELKAAEAQRDEARKAVENAEAGRKAAEEQAAALRAELEGVYIKALRQFRDVDEEKFMEKYRLITLVRLLQEFGAYGFRGLVERKQLFIDCIPTALGCIRELTEVPFRRYPYLDSVLRRLVNDWDGRTILPGVKVEF